MNSCELFWYLNTRYLINNIIMRNLIVCLALFVAGSSVCLAKGGSIRKADDLSNKEFKKIVEYCQRELPKLWAIMETIKDDGVHVKISGEMRGPGKASGKDRMVIGSKFLIDDMPQFPEDRLIIVLYHEFGHIKLNRETARGQRNPVKHELAAFSYSLEAAKKMAEDGDYGPLEQVLHFLKLRLERGQAKDPHTLALRQLVGNDLWEECVSVLEEKQ